jgi:hypothetical protein
MSDWLKNAEGVATVVIAVYVASVGTLQWFIAREKLRLDLYDRRFNVYVNSVQYMQTVVDWQLLDAETRIADRRAFIHAVRESRFFFADEERIFRLLEEFNIRSFKVTAFIEQNHSAEALYDNPRFQQRYAEHQSQLEWITNAPIRLEEHLLPYIGFRHREFRTFFRRGRSGTDSSKPNRR